MFLSCLLRCLALPCLTSPNLPCSTLEADCETSRDGTAKKLAPWKTRGSRSAIKMPARRTSKFALIGYCVYSELVQPAHGFFRAAGRVSSSSPTPDPPDPTLAARHSGSSQTPRKTATGSGTGTGTPVERSRMQPRSSQGRGERWSALADWHGRRADQSKQAGGRGAG